MKIGIVCYASVGGSGIVATELGSTAVAVAVIAVVSVLLALFPAAATKIDVISRRPCGS